MVETLPGITRYPIGRDELLSKTLYPRLKKGQSFRLDGQAGIGKTTLLYWSYCNSDTQIKVLFTCSDPRKAILTKIAVALGIENALKLTADKLTHAIITSDSKCELFIDNIEVIKPQIITLLRTVPEWTKFYAGKDGRIKEDFKPVIWGVKKIKIDRLGKQDAAKLAKQAVKDLGSSVDVREVVGGAKGVPGRILASCRGEMLRSEENVASEEINFMPFAVALGVACLVIVRYTGRAAGQADLYLIGCIGMGVAMVLRFFATK